VPNETTCHAPFGKMFGEMLEADVVRRRGENPV
jgi:hypothetical protein